jgi:hypothetical protein
LRKDGTDLGAIDKHRNGFEVSGVSQVDATRHADGVATNPGSPCRQLKGHGSESRYFRTATELDGIGREPVFVGAQAAPIREQPLFTSSLESIGVAQQLVVISLGIFGADIPDRRPDEGVEVMLANIHLGNADALASERVGVS